MAEAGMVMVVSGALLPPPKDFRGLPSDRHLQAGRQVALRQLQASEIGLLSRNSLSIFANFFKKRRLMVIEHPQSQVEEVPQIVAVYERLAYQR